MCAKAGRMRSASRSRRSGEGAANLTKPVAAMRGVPEAGRGAYFVCVPLAVGPGDEEQISEGRRIGRPADAPRGGAGFGNDPLFVPEGLG